MHLYHLFRSSNDKVITLAALRQHLPPPQTVGLQETTRILESISESVLILGII